MFPYKYDFNISMRKDSATTVYLQTLIREEHERRMEKELEELLKHCPEHEREHYTEEHRGFLKLFQKHIAEREASIIWDEIEPLPRGSFLDYNNFLIPRHSAIQMLLNKLVVVKLNGGLGTRMKCDGPKSLIPVRNDLTFLDLTVQQIENLNAEFETSVPLVLMNSFNTKEETEKTLRKYRNLKIKIYTFMQNKYPRIHAENLTVLATSYNDPKQDVWYPPGHGNFYEAFHKSGLIEKFKEDEREFCFVSNIDNLGAVVDFRILDLIGNSRMDIPPEFVMEVTSKTSADIKGGTLIYYGGKPKLLEYAEVPKDRVDDFKCPRKFENFNTNNLWIKLDSITELVTEDKLSFDVIGNKKQIYRDGSKIEILQLETAAGAAIRSFDRAVGILVPRSRFLPVKTTSDLFLLRSNVFINDNGKLIMNPLRPFPEVPLISLADDSFGDFRDLDKRFENMPDCINLNHLTISGDVYFGKKVVLNGNVTIVADHKGRIDIPKGSILQYKIVTGCLRIVDF